MIKKKISLHRCCQENEKTNNTNKSTSDFIFIRFLEIHVNNVPYLTIKMNGI